jgi:hypothetical protein
MVTSRRDFSQMFSSNLILRRNIAEKPQFGKAERKQKAASPVLQSLFK